MPEGNTSNGAGTTSAGSGPMSIDAAFAAAVGEHSEPAATAEEHGDGDGGSETDPGTEDGSSDDNTDDGDEQPAAHSSEERQTEEASTGDEDESGDSDEKAAGEKEESEEEIDLTASDLDQPKLKAYLDSLPNDEARAAARKYINASIAPKFQAIARAKNFLEAFRKDPVAAAKQILREKGVEVPETTTSKKTGDEKTTSAAPSEMVSNFMKAGFTKEQATAMEAVVKPVVTKQQEADVAAIAAHFESEVNTFKKTHPEFDRLEGAISKLMDEMPAGPNADVQVYLDRLYTLALGSDNKKAVAKNVKKTLDKIADNAAAAAPKTRGVPSSHVQPGKSGPLDINDSFELALRGETRGRGIKTRSAS